MLNKLWSGGLGMSRSHLKGTDRRKASRSYGQIRQICQQKIEFLSFPSPPPSAATTSSRASTAVWAGGCSRRSHGQSCASCPKARPWRARSCGIEQVVEIVQVVQNVFGELTQRHPCGYFLPQTG